MFNYVNDALLIRYGIILHKYSAHLNVHSGYPLSTRLKEDML